jgi:hypothetical protein
MGQRVIGAGTDRPQTVLRETTAGSHRSSHGGSGWAVVVGMAWLAAGVGPLVLTSAISHDGQYFSIVALSALSLVFGLWVFWRDGGRWMTAVGIYNFAFALFVGFAGLYQVSGAAANGSLGPLLHALTFCYFSHVCTWLLCWRRRSPPPRLADTPVDPAVTRWSVVMGLSLLLGAVAAATALPAPLPLFVEPAGFVGVLLLGAGLLRGSFRRKWLVWGVILTAAFTLYFDYLFNEFGRIKLGALGFGLFVILAHGGRGRWAKSLVVLGSAPALIFLASIRANPVADQSGLGSMMSPLRDFGALLSLNDAGLLPKGLGHTFFASLVALVPRSMWADKPVGFGSELVPLLSPQLVGTGHSSAALFFGEWVFNFGLPGLVVMVPIVGLAIRGIDALLVRQVARPIADRRALLRYLTATVVVVGMIDLMWVGTFTYMARTGPRLLVLGVFVILFGIPVRRRAGLGLPSGTRPPLVRAGRHRTGRGPN